jgi:hypothetical protein
LVDFVFLVISHIVHDADADTASIYTKEAITVFVRALRDDNDEKNYKGWCNREREREKKMNRKQQVWRMAIINAESNFTII